MRGVRWLVQYQLSIHYAVNTCVDHALVDSDISCSAAVETLVSALASAETIFDIRCADSGLYFSVEKHVTVRLGDYNC